MRTITPFRFPGYSPESDKDPLPEVVDTTIVPLSSNMRVVGLPRKSKNGTRFYIVDSLQMNKKRGEAPKGYAVVVKTSKDGKVVARLTSGGSLISFKAKNKTIWPVTKPGNPDGLKQLKSKKQVAALTAADAAALARLNRRARA